MEKKCKLISYTGILLLLLLTINPASAAVITVNNSTGDPADFTTISAAVEYANNGDTLLVFPGTYTENVDVAKELIIKSASGNPGDTTVKIANPEEECVFNVHANNVVISGFNISGDTSTDYYYGNDGIHLSQAENCSIENNTFSDSYRAIYMYYSDSNNLRNNIISSASSYSIYLYDSDSNNLSNNIISSASSYGIYLYDSNSNNLNGNIVSNYDYYGIFLYNSNSNNLTENSASDGNCGLCLSDSTGNNLTGNLMQNNSYNFKAYGPQMENNISTSNNVDGKPIYYLVNVTSPTEINSSSNAGTIYLINCKNITVKDLLLKNNGKGIHLYNTMYSTIENNIMENNECDIYLEKSYDNHLTGNILGTASDYGTYLYSSDRNVLSDNTISSASSYGIYLYDSDSNNLTENSVSDGNCGLCLSSSTGNYLADNLMQNNSYNFKAYEPQLENNISISNSVDGKPIYYLVNVISPTEINSSSNAGTVYLINCKNITVKDLLLKKQWGRSTSLQY